MRTLYSICLASLLLLACKNEPGETRAVSGEEVGQQPAATDTSENDIQIEPIEHATAVISWGETTIYLDPTGGAEAFSGKDQSDLVLITDIHGDHMDPETLGDLNLGDTPIFAPQAVADQLPDSLSTRITVINNGEQKEFSEFTIEAIPMYNLREEAKQFHPVGRGNGYVLEKDGQRLYIAGDTEDIPEMRQLSDIDIALVPMNLPYTMTVEKAAEAVIEFAPKKVYPYHFRGTEGMADVEEFERLVNEANKDIEVVRVNWYPNGDS